MSKLYNTIGNSSKQECINNICTLYTRIKGDL